MVLLVLTACAPKLVGRSPAELVPLERRPSTASTANRPVRTPVVDRSVAATSSPSQTPAAPSSATDVPRGTSGVAVGTELPAASTGPQWKVSITRSTENSQSMPASSVSVSPLSPRPAPPPSNDVAVWATVIAIVLATGFLYWFRKPA
jgi:cobalamin biosynthesis Mg chelatase CobN